MLQKTVLVIEDDKDIRQAMRESLELMGYQVAVAENGRVALDYLEAGNIPCLILLDLMMPVMDGWQFRKIQEQDRRFKDIPLIVVSADANAKQKALTLKATGTLVKPVDFEQLVQAAEAYCS